jgi:Arc/MetJ family transcription regulator
MTQRRATTVEIDTELLAAAREALGTRGLEDTIDQALTEAVQTSRRRRLAERLRTGEGIDRELLDQEARTNHWR